VRSRTGTEARDLLDGVIESCHRGATGRLSTILDSRKSWRHLESEVLLAEGRHDEAIELLGQILDEPFPQHESFFLASELLAEILEQRGDAFGAVRALEAASFVNRVALSQPALWVRAQSRLLALYGRLGLGDQERHLAEQLAKLLVFADSDHPVVLQLQDLGIFLPTIEASSTAGGG